MLVCMGKGVLGKNALSLFMLCIIVHVVSLFMLYHTHTSQPTYSLPTPRAVVMDRAQKSGVLLAHVLMSCCHGGRPVTLIGYSMGARVLYYCLQELVAYNALGRFCRGGWWRENKGRREVEGKRGEDCIF